VSAGPRSEELFARARRVLPGGVNSPVRAFRSVGGTPLVMKRGAGAEIEDVDGRRFVDFVCSWGPLILGHAPRRVVEAVTRVAADGTSFGAPCEVEIELAEKVVSLVPHLEQVRFVSSGTEAVMSAVRLARGATGRDLIVKFSGCYHGHVDHLLVAAGSGLVTFGTPSSAGVPEPFAELTLVLPLDDEQKFVELMQAQGDRVAAVILEPIPANNGLLLQRRAFLETLRRVTERHGALLIFDEVISGFRVAPGGAAQLYEIRPDLATYGKVIGGGLPVGAFGGRADLMGHLAPLGRVYQAGTLSGNPVAMAAGLATLAELQEKDGWARLEALGAALEAALVPVCRNAPVPVGFTRVGSIFWLPMQAGDPPHAAECVHPGAAELYRRVFHGLLARGIAMAPSAYEVGFLSTAHGEAHVAKLADALAGALADAAK
jgi:glutamate-1-semialdehyde 2,1-aminomutase